MSVGKFKVLGYGMYCTSVPLVPIGLAKSAAHLLNVEIIHSYIFIFYVGGISIVSQV